MPNPYGFQFRSSPCPAVWDLFGKVTIGAAGAPTLVAINSLGIASVSRVSAGLYSIVLGQKYQRLLMVNAVFVAGGANAPIFSIALDNVASTGILRVQFRNDAGAATDPGNGEVLLLDIIVKNSSVVAG